MYDQPVPAAEPEVKSESVRKRSLASVILGGFSLFCTLGGIAGHLAFAIATRGFGGFFLIFYLHPAFLIPAPFGLASGIVGLNLGKRGIRRSRAAGLPVTLAKIGFVLSLVGLIICAYQITLVIAESDVWSSMMGLEE